MKTIFITGATDGIGLATAKELAGQGHALVLHGRNEEKLTRACNAIRAVAPGVKLPVPIWLTLGRWRAWRKTSRRVCRIWMC